MRFLTWVAICIVVCGAALWLMGCEADRRYRYFVTAPDTVTVRDTVTVTDTIYIKRRWRR